MKSHSGMMIKSLLKEKNNKIAINIQKFRFGLNRFVIQFRLQLLVVGDFSRSFHEVLLDNVVSLGTDGEHS